MRKEKTRGSEEKMDQILRSQSYNSTRGKQKMDCQKCHNERNTIQSTKMGEKEKEKLHTSENP